MNLQWKIGSHVGFSIFLHVFYTLYCTGRSPYVKIIFCTNLCTNLHKKRYLWENFILSVDSFHDLNKNHWFLSKNFTVHLNLASGLNRSVELNFLAQIDSFDSKINSQLPAEVYRGHNPLKSCLGWLKTPIRVN